jgi:hypothetical protein
MAKFISSKSAILIITILVLAVIRLLPHPPNFTPIAAMALFGGAYFSSRWMAFVITLGAMFLSDILLGFHGGTMVAVYFSFMLVVMLGTLLKRNITLATVPLMALVSAILFFLITNLAVWMGSPIYSQDFSGLVVCYTAAIPFFHYSLLGNLVFTTILFGGFSLASLKFPILAPER